MKHSSDKEEEEEEVVVGGGGVVQYRWISAPAKLEFLPASVALYLGTAPAATLSHLLLLPPPLKPLRVISAKEHRLCSRRRVHAGGTPPSQQPLPVASGGSKSSSTSRQNWPP